jgi:hypothetical protein
MIRSYVTIWYTYGTCLQNVGLVSLNHATLFELERVLAS